MYCWNCGKEIDEKSVFCSHCGMKQGGSHEPPKEKRKGVMLPVICAAICVGALLAMLLLLTGDRERSAAPAEPAATASTAAAETEPVQTQTAAPTTAPTESQIQLDPYSAALPDLASFLNTEYTQDEWGYTHYVTCLIDKEDEDAIVEEVLDLLKEPRYQLMQMGRNTTTENSKKCINYTFEYTGENPDIDWVYLKSGGQYHVKLTQMDYSSSQTALILYTYPEFWLEDPGSRSEYGGASEEKSDAGSDNGGSSGSLYKDKCWSCGGDGRCNTCGGSGRVREWAGDMYVNVRCTRCNGGSCRQCGGDGKK